MVSNGLVKIQTPLRRREASRKRTIGEARIGGMTRLWHLRALRK
jgi:hypothetical protein